MKLEKNISNYKKMKKLQKNGRIFKTLSIIIIF